MKIGVRGDEMEFKLIIDKEHKEEVIVFAKEKNSLVKEIEELVLNTSDVLTGYKGEEMVIINLCDVYCFTIEKNKLYAIMRNERLQIKQRLYQIENMLGKNFVKINQSSIANIKQIDRFYASFGGSLGVKFKNGYKDYVSRRQARMVKERMGL